MLSKYNKIKLIKWGRGFIKDFKNQLVSLFLIIIIIAQGHQYKKIIHQYKSMVEVNIETIQIRDSVIDGSFKLIQSQDSILENYEVMADEYIQHLNKCNNK